jgi:hypothetical protein
VKVKLENVVRIAVTLGIAGGLFAFLYNYRQLRQMAGFPEIIVDSIMGVVILLIPLILVSRLRRNRPLNAAHFCLLAGLIVISNWEANGNSLSVYVLGFLWLSTVFIVVAEFIGWHRKRKSEKLGGSTAPLPVTHKLD